MKVAGVHRNGKTLTALLLAHVFFKLTGHQAASQCPGHHRASNERSRAKVRCRGPGVFNRGNGEDVLFDVVKYGTFLNVWLTNEQSKM